MLESEFIIACDVETPFWGPEGAAAVFGPQKGATPDTVAILEEGMQSLGRVIIRDLGIDLSAVKGSGAAGGPAGLDGRESGDSDTVGSYWESLGYNSWEELLEAVKDGAMVMDDDGNIIVNKQYQQRTNTLTNREVLALAVVQTGSRRIYTISRHTSDTGGMAAFLRPFCWVIPDIFP